MARKPRTEMDPQPEPEAPTNRPLDPSEAMDLANGEAPPLDILDHLATETGEGAANDNGDTVCEIAGGPPGVLPADQWRDLIGSVIQMTGNVAGLTTLERSTRAAGFDAAAFEMHKVCCETPSLHWLVAPDNPTFKSVIIIGSWAVPVAVGCYQEIADKRSAARVAARVRAERAETVEAPQAAPQAAPAAPANDDAPEHDPGV